MEEEVKALAGSTQPEPEKPSAARRIRKVLLSPVAKGGFIGEFFRGFKYLFRGLKAVFSYRRDLWLWALIPVVLSTMLYVIMFLVMIFKLDDFIQLFLPSVDESVFWKAIMVVLWIVVMAAVVVAGYFLFIPIMNVIACPFNEILSEKVEVLLLHKEAPPFIFKIFVQEIAIAVFQEIIKLLIYAVFMLPLLVLNFLIPVVGPVLFILIGGFITSIYLSYDQLDRCFSRHTMPIGKRLGFMKRYFWRVLGLGTAGVLLLLIPGAVFVVLPGSVAGGAMLFLESDEVELPPPAENGEREL